MKRINYLAKGILAAVVIVMFAQCNGKKADADESVDTNTKGAMPSNLKVAYVEIDTLLTKYNFWNDLNEMMMKKEENR